jgi:hypothetical protein
MKVPLTADCRKIQLNNIHAALSSEKQFSITEKNRHLHSMVINIFPYIINPLVYEM